MKISTLAKNIAPSATLSITAKAKEMKKQGVDVVSFAAGEPDFDTPLSIKEAAKKAIDEGFTKYTATSGILELKEVITKKLLKENNLQYSPKEILVTNGAKQALFNIIMTLVDKDDEVIVPVPYWVSYVEMIKMAQGKPVFLKTKDFIVDPDLLEKTITKKTKLLILNSPNNPTGAVYDEKILEKIAKICVKHNLLVISDEIYEKLVYDKKHVSIASLSKKIKNLTVVINGVSKTYAMTGWRIGYAAGPEEVIKAATKIQDHSTSNPSSISQKAALAALTLEQNEVTKMVLEYKKRRDFMMSGLSLIKNIYPFYPHGAFYVFVNVKKLYQKEIKNSVDFCQRLLDEAYVAAIPGAAFGDDSYIRLSFATDIQSIKKGLERLKNFCERI
jgi:aspartate aminotransferase